MSERYVWDRYGVKTQIQENIKYVVESYIDHSGRARRFRVGASYTLNSDGSVSLHSTKEVDLPAHGSIAYTYQDSELYPYCAIYDISNKVYKTPIFHSNYGQGWYWEFRYTGDGYTMFMHLGNSSTNPTQYGDIEAITPTKQTVSNGIKNGQVSSSSGSSYPSNGSSGNSWYMYKGSDSIDPLSVVYSSDEPDKGKPILVTTQPAVNTLGGTISYLYQYSIDGGRTWTSAGTATTATEKEILVPADAEQFMVRVRAQDDMGFVSNDYVVGENLKVVSIKMWVGVDGKARLVKKLWIGVDGKAHEVSNGWVGVDGKAHRFS